MRSPQCRGRGRAKRRPAWRPGIATERCRAALVLCALCATILSPRPAAAQLGGSITLSSQSRLRGQPVSDHHPVAELELVHDSASGFYLGGSAAVILSRDGGVQPFAFRQYAGYARRLAPGLSMDLGVVHNGYTGYSGISGGSSYSEAYLGVISRNLSGRVFLSPGYFRRHAPTLYAEVEGHADLNPNWLIFAHGGRLTYLGDYASASDRGDATDWRIGVRRRAGSIDLEAAWTGYAEEERPGHARHTDGALVIGLAFAF